MGRKIKHNQQTNLDEERFVANVPLRISLIYNGENIFEFTQVVDIVFTTETREGMKNNLTLLGLKHAKGLATEDALFEMAKTDFLENDKYVASKLRFPNLKGLEGTHDLKVDIKSNGEIQYRKPSKK
jgi:hypothetical protein